MSCVGLDQVIQDGLVEGIKNGRAVGNGVAADKDEIIENSTGRGNGQDSQRR